MSVDTMPFSVLSLLPVGVVLITVATLLREREDKIPSTVCLVLGLGIVVVAVSLFSALWRY